MDAIKGFLVSHVFALVSGPLIGAVVFVLHEQLQRAWAWLDAQSPLVKRVAAFLLAALLAPIATALGVEIPAACTGAVVTASDCLAAIASKDWLAGAVGGAVALGLHAVVKPKGTR